MMIVCFPQIYFPVFKLDFWKQKELQISEIIQYFQKSFRNYDLRTRVLHRKCAMWLRLSHNLVLVFEVENSLNWKSENIEYVGVSASNLCNFSPCAWDNNWLSKKNYWKDLDSINQGRSKPNGPQFLLYLGCPWINFNNISTTVIASQPAKKVKPSDIENGYQDQHLQKFLIFLHIRDFNQSFTKMMKLFWPQSNHISWPWNRKSWLNIFRKEPYNLIFYS